ncbi:MAG: hypothetical protein WBX17_04820 [Microbacterium sp.]
MSHARTAPAARALGAVAIVAAAALFTACQPEPAATPSAEPTTSVSPRPGGASPTPIESQTPDAEFALPAACEDIYSATMRGRLEVENPPLNHPDVTMLSTQNVDLLEIIDSGAPTIRCSWGTPSEFGLATNVTVIGTEQAATVEAELMASGLACEPYADGTICRIEQKGITLDDEEYASGETHFVGGGGWVSTAWINFAPEGYSEDIVATLWG